MVIRVLILEDHLSDAELMVRELRRNQLEVEWQRVDTESDYLAHLNSTLPDVILSDYHMPQLDAARALQLLRQTSRDVPFIVVSGAIGEDVAVNLMRSGASDYLLKDRLARLGPAVRNALQEKALRTEARKAEEALQASETRFHLFMNNSPALAFIKDEDGRILYINSTCERTWNTTLAKCAGKLDCELWPADVAATLHAHDLSVLRSGASDRAIEQLPLPNGSELQLLSFRFPFADANGRQLLGKVSVDISEQVRTEQALSAAFSAKEALLRELHHRVKNNLQVISSLLAMQAASLNDFGVAQALEESQKRVQCMALIHERLNQNNLDRLDFREYVETLSRDLFYSRCVDPARVGLRFELEPVLLGSGQAMPCGLILNELVSNSLQHAFPGGRTGEIVISLSCDRNDLVTLAVADDGVGLRADFDLSPSTSLGLQIVEILTQQLEGTLHRETGNGAAFSLRFQRALEPCGDDIPSLSRAAS
ncbi:MAG TPA: histidine kinase dimerization/phosphoacceptor domain -containing protein [Bryobacteraceae bacterium]|nr:histidine kinase dimerization/phosphoacceptor domain -containing protein [Bryobacteraceae bacterium]